MPESLTSHEMAAVLQGGPSIKEKLATMRPQERVVELFEAMIKAPIQNLPGMKRFLAEQAFEAFWPAVREDFLTMSDEKTVAWLQTSKQMMDTFANIISEGLPEVNVVGGGAIEGSTIAE